MRYHDWFSNTSSINSWWPDFGQVYVMEANKLLPLYIAICQDSKPLCPTNSEVICEWMSRLIFFFFQWHSLDHRQHLEMK